jgi:glycosyltransferase involved in cell wall biosynthesis
MARKIRVLNVLPFGDIGGAQKFILSLCRWHDKSRFSVKVAVLFSGGTISDQICNENYEVNILNMRNGFDLTRALRIVPLIRKDKTDIVNIHVQNPLGKLFAILSRPPVIVHTDHGTTLSSPVKRKQRIVLFNRILSPFINHFVAISNNMQQSLLIREKIPFNKISLIYNGVDVEKISKDSCNKEDLRKSLGIPSDVPVLGTVGRLAPEKQYPILFKVLSIIKDKGVNFFMIIVGDGPERSHLENIAEKFDLSGQIRFLGYRSDITQLLDLINVFVFTSGGEAFSLTLLEAMAKAKPIVAFDVEGVNEAVVNEKSGFLVPPGDIETFSQKIKILFESKELSEQMGKSGFERVNSMFNLKANIHRLESLYENLMQNYKHKNFK